MCPGGRDWVGERVTAAGHPATACLPVSVCALCVLLAFCCVSPSRAVAQRFTVATPLPTTDYSARPLCPPAEPGQARCLAEELVAETPAARAHTSPIGMARAVPIGPDGATKVCPVPNAQEGCWGLRPEDLHTAYALPWTASGAPQTIAIVDAYNSPKLRKDLKIYDKVFHLRECTRKNQCLRIINQDGRSAPLPETEGRWAGEISLDVEITHAICTTCDILLVEAKSAKLPDFEAAEERAVAAGATEISNSWVEFEPAAVNTSVFDHPGIVITAASGDEGYLNWDLPASPIYRGFVNIPASLPNVVAVGGTRLTLDPASAWMQETVWNGDKGATGGGCSGRFTAPGWQLELANWARVGCGSHRAVADVAADGDPYTGAAVYDTTPNPEHRGPWFTIGGTSLASPIIAATFALAGGAQGVEAPARTMYENELADPASLHDVESGSSGECLVGVNSAGLSECAVGEEAASCSGGAVCVAGPGYDGPSGVGTPNGLGAFTPTGRAAKKSQLIEFTSSAPASASVGGGAYAISATATSGLAVSFTSITPSVCTVAGAAASFIGAGTCTIAASQAGSPDYYPAPQAQQSLAVGQGEQLITFTSTPPSAASVGAGTYEVAASASSGLPVSFSSASPSVCTVAGATVSFVGAGRCTIDANQAGDADYLPASDAQQSFGVASLIPIVKPAGESGTLSFTSLQPPAPLAPDSNFSLQGAPALNRRTGAVTFTVSVANRGALNWLVTFSNGKFGVYQASTGTCKSGEVRLAGRCRAARIVFARGSLTATAPGRLSFTARPSASAKKALKLASEKGQGVPITARLTFQSALGGSPVSHARSLTDRLAHAGKGR
jgi:Subtilase family